MIRRGKQLESTKSQLANRLSKVTQDFACELKREKMRSMSLESTVVRKEKDMMVLMNSVRETEEKQQKGLLRDIVHRMNRNSKKKGISIKRGEQFRPSSSPAVQAQAAAKVVTPKTQQLGISDVSTVRSAPSRSESLCSTSGRSQGYKLSNFLESITSLSRFVEDADLVKGESEQIESSICAFQEEIQRCIENWSQGEVPQEEILGLMERVFEE